MSLHSDLITPSPSADEIDAALAAAQVHSDTIEFAEFLEIHRQMRWLRRNPAIRSSPDIARNTGSDALTRTGPAAKRAGSSGATKSRAGKVDESLDAEQEAMRTSKMMAEMERDEQQAAIMRLHFFERRLRMSSKASTMIMEAFLKAPVENKHPLGAQQKKFSSAYSYEQFPVTQQRNARDVCELVKLFRKSADMSEMPNETISELAQCCTCLFFPSGSVIFDRKDWGSGFWIILLGIADVHTRRDDGTRLNVAELRAGQCFGEMFLLFGEFLPRRFKVQASTEGVLAAFVDREDYFAIGLDVHHRRTTWESLSKKHTLLLQMQTLSHLDPIDTFHLCHQLREKRVPARSEVYNSSTDAIEIPKADQLFRDSTVFHEHPDKVLFLVQAGTCDLWAEAPKQEKKTEIIGHERDLSKVSRYSMKGEQGSLYCVSNLAAGTPDVIKCMHLCACTSMTYAVFCLYAFLHVHGHTK
jgi:hypothetical protein